MSALDELRRHADELEREAGIQIQLIEVGMQIYALLEKVQLPVGAYRLDTTEVLFITDQQYPFSAMDMFWTEVDVVRSDGTIPLSAESIEPHLDRQWRRFSWHRNGVWRPTGNCLIDHFEFMQARFAQDVTR